MEQSDKDILIGMARRYEYGYGAILRVLADDAAEAVNKLDGWPEQSEASHRADMIDRAARAFGE